MSKKKQRMSKKKGVPLEIDLRSYLVYQWEGLARVREIHVCYGNDR